jgi:hypothetical protein
MPALLGRDHPGCAVADVAEALTASLDSEIATEVPIDSR